MMYFIISAIVILLDQLTKKLVVNRMQLGTSKSIISGLLDFSYIHNDGAAYSILQGKQTLLIVFTVALMVGIIVYAIVYRDKIKPLEAVSLALILGGGIGNLIDRIAQSYVVDFINIHIIPVFNVADIAITCGCVLFVIAVLFPKKSDEQ